MNASTPELNEKIDLTNCEREQIHKLSRVQPYGYLLSFTVDWVLQGYSENVSELFNKKIDGMLRMDAFELFEDKALSRLRSSLVWLNGSNASEKLFSMDLLGDGRYFDVAIYMAGRSIVVELEPSDTLHDYTLVPMVRMILKRLGAEKDYANYLKMATSAVRELTGFDRVMLYRFHEDDSGEVIAESCNHGVDSFMGLRFPASDIPKQARELYKLNLIRIISDVEHEPVPLYPPTASLPEALDLSLSGIRAVSEMHIEYLKNMGVRSSMSISIMVDGRLWGLFACHHMSPRYLSLNVRSAAELFAELFAMDLANREREKLYTLENKAYQLHDQLMATMQSNASVLETLLQHVDVFNELIPSDGMIIYMDGDYQTYGTTFSSEEITLLVAALQKMNINDVYTSNELARDIKIRLDMSDKVAGLLVVPISRMPRDMMIFVRNEEPRTVNWAGNPEKPVELGPNGSRLTPRKSFEIWQELRHGVCQEWQPVEVKIASQIKNIILEVLIRNIDERERMREQAQHKQDLLVHELNHRVRNILGLIRSIVNRTAESSNDIDEFKCVLDGRVQALATAHDQLTEKDWSPAPLRQLIQNEINAFTAGRQDAFRMDGPDIALNPEAYSCLTLVLHEMVTNSVKHGALSISHGHVEIRWQVIGNGSLEIIWKEWGKTFSELPKRRGFGSTIIERSIPFELGGESKLDFTLSGLNAKFSIPRRYIMLSGMPDNITPLKSPQMNESKGDNDTVLLVEDNLIIALDAEQMLGDIGFSHVLVASNVHDAFEMILNHDKCGLAKKLIESSE